MSKSILQQVASGDPDAFTACIDRFGGLVWSLARKFLDQPGEAEDAVQEIFIELWKNASKFDPTIAAETTFVAMIARRRLIDRQRRNSRRPHSEAVTLEHLPNTQPDRVMQLETHEEAAKVVSALEQIKPEQRNVLKLAVCDGWTHQTIAERLGLPIGTVKTHVRRGLMTIREELDAT